MMSVNNLTVWKQSDSCFFHPERGLGSTKKGYTLQGIVKCSDWLSFPPKKIKTNQI